MFFKDFRNALSHPVENKGDLEVYPANIAECDYSSGEEKCPSIGGIKFTSSKVKDENKKNFQLDLIIDKLKFFQNEFEIAFKKVKAENGFQDRIR